MLHRRTRASGVITGFFDDSLSFTHWDLDKKVTQVIARANKEKRKKEYLLQ
jgi:hypothetical protein